MNSNFTISEYIEPESARHYEVYPFPWVAPKSRLLFPHVFCLPKQTIFLRNLRRVILKSSSKLKLKR